MSRTAQEDFVDWDEEERRKTKGRSVTDWIRARLVPGQVRHWGGHPVDSEKYDAYELSGKGELRGDEAKKAKEEVRRLRAIRSLLNKDKRTGD